MDKPSPDLPHGPNVGRLESWKKIAVYLKRDVTTVQRWEKREGMPVHRHVHDRMGSVYTFRADLDAGMPSRNHRAAQETANDAALSDPPAPPPQPVVSASRNRKRLLLPLAAAAAALA